METNMENYGIVEFESKTVKSGNNIFNDCSYDPDIYNKIVSIYDAGNKVQLEKWKWKPKQKTDEKFGVYTTVEKDIRETILCPTLKDFDREVWDIFADFVEAHAVDIIWYSPMDLRARNPEKPQVAYYDGMVFGRTHKEFLEITDMKNENVSRFLSCLVHFGYDCPQFRFIDKIQNNKIEGASGYSSFSLR